MKNLFAYKKIFLIFLGWTAFGLFFALQSYLGNVYLGQEVSFFPFLWAWLIAGYAWMILAPAVFFLAEKFPIKRGNIGKNLLIHLVAAIGVALIHLSLIVIFRHVFLRGINSPFTFVETFQRLLLSNINFDFLGYWILVAFAHFRDANRRYLEREKEAAQIAVKAAQLETQLAQSQLNSLKMQLHPHFLFNTLNSISALIHDDAKTANEMLVRLSELLRIALNSEKMQKVSLKEELEFLQSYLEIEKMRLQDGLTVHFEIEKETLDAKIPNLILQPIVENAVKHGISSLSEGGKLLIKSRLENGFVELSVKDNGVGIKDSAIKSNGIGLKNTQERLEKIYGENHTFEIILDDGVSVKIKIPYNRYEQ
jgi:two-component system, LytTR family, sensor kinase